MRNRIEEITKHYYTCNHLSSTQLVTDGTGDAVQQVEYAPFGEVVNEYNIDWSNGQVPDFKFNGKELDEESRMYYFEARYQSPPVFISRDPLFEKYPMFSPYSYCANNPIKYIDPDGRTLKIAYYEYRNGKAVQKVFIFNGKNQNQAPNNWFVNYVIDAYNYSVNNGGGQKMQEAATDQNITIYVLCNP
ncbi:MAG: RHS repeat-associated core domain-containing protein, partial [Bacteroidales bacterium]|nr:RHS repeat-associated core domain-containing protein [Bacteroidales bacterium]